MLERIPLIYYALSGLLNFVSLFALAIFVFSNNTKSPVNKIFSVFTLAASGWGLFHFLWLTTTTNSRLAEFYLRTVMLFVIFMPTTFTHFIFTFLKVDLKTGIYRRINLSNYLISFLLGLTVYTPLFAKDISPFLVFPYWLKPGPVFHFHVIHFVGNVIYSHFLLLRALKRNSGIFRNQVLYIFIGTIIGYAAGIFNYLPWYRVPIPPFLNPLVSVYVIFVGYAIIKYRLMNIEVIIKKTLVFAGLSAFVLGCITITTFTIQDVLGRFIGLPKALSYVFTAIILIALYEPIKNFLVKVTDKYLFQKKYNYRQAMKFFIDNVVTLLDIDKIVSETIDFLEKIFHPLYSDILLLNSDKYISHGAKNKSTPRIIEKDSPITEYLKSTRGILSIEDENNKKISEEIKNEMLGLKASLAVPLLIRDELIGFILLGKKKSDEYYTVEDLNMLMDLTRTLAIAISNSISHSLLLESQKKQAQSERLVSMGYLVTNLSHEIRNPINNIALIAKDTLDEIDFNLNLKDIADQKQRESISFIIDKLNDVIEKNQKANTVFNSILNIMKIDKKKFAPLDIKKIIDEDISRITPYIKESNIKVINLIPDNFPSFKGDEVIIEQVFFNLINNAVQAITLSRVGDKIEIRASDLGDKVRIEVEDNSSGIPKYDIDRIFEPFYTTKDNLHVYATGKSKGIGIGLMIAHHVVTAHDGTITVKSEEGKGADFIVEIPKEVKI